MKNNNQNIVSIAERMKVVLLNQGFWDSKPQHKAESREENIRHSLESNDAEVRIKLVKNHESLSKAKSIKGQIYIEHRRLTLPSPVDGMRIVPMGREFEHSDKISKLRQEFISHVQVFLDDYDNVVESSRQRLKGLFDQNMFPPQHVMKSKFYNNVKYMDCPTSGSWGEWIGETVELGRIELRDRLVVSARKLIDTCQGDGKLYSSVLENLEDICDLTGDFNLSEDPIIARAAKELLPIATDFSAEVLRDNKSLRANTAIRAKQILSVLNLS